MAFKIKNNVIDLSSINAGLVNFTANFSGFSRSQTNPLNCSFTDDQGFLWDTKGIATITSNRTASSSRTGSDGLAKQAYQLGTMQCGPGYTCYVVSWTENNSNMTINLGGFSCFGICPDRSNHTATVTCYPRYYYDSVYWGATSFMCWDNYTADGCLKQLRVL